MRLAIVSLPSAAFVAADGAALASVKVGATAPAFVGPAFDGATIDLADLRCKLVLPHAWAIWRPPCRAEMPALDAFARAHPETVAVLALSEDTRRDLAGFRLRKAAICISPPHQA